MTLTINTDLLPLDKLQQRVTAVQKTHSWSIGMDTLYTMCEEHPSQSDPTAIVSKFWLIGRAYSATVERRHTKNEDDALKNQNIYTDRLVPAYQSANFDDMFASLQHYQQIDEQNIDHIVEVHNAVTQVLYSVTKQWKRSLASKYLHFHFPHLYFIYDSRAKHSLRRYIPNWGRGNVPNDARYDRYYHRFCFGMLALRDYITAQTGVELVPKHLDNFLLG